MVARVVAVAETASSKKGDKASKADGQDFTLSLIEWPPSLVFSSVPKKQHLA